MRRAKRPAPYFDDGIGDRRSIIVTGVLVGIEVEVERSQSRQSAAQAVSNETDQRQIEPSTLCTPDSDLFPKFFP